MNYLLVKNYKKGEFKKYYDDYDKDKKVEILKKDIDINNDDVIYIAFYNLPDGKNRLFLRAKLLSKKNGVIYARSLRGISDYYNDKYLLDDINLKEGLYEEFPKEWKEVLTIEYDELSPFDNSKEYYRISNLKDYFYDDAKCALCKENKYDTFKTVNGMNFVEFHHFIQRKSSNEKLDEIIKRDDNLIKLCPTCHSKIHYAEFNTRREAINEIYSGLSSDFKEELKRALKLNDKEVKEWIFESYLNEREKILWNNTK